ncbi:MAG: nucleotidyltransferase domain-containing protein [Bacteroidota bacterium]
MTITDLEARQLIIYKCVSGSKAYGLDVPGSDTDIRGVFLLPQNELYGFNYLPQVSDERNDEVYYELGRFIDLLAKNNPNMLELLATPERHILYKHPLLNQLDPSLFLSKKCKKSFAGFAFTQIRKARGLNKKIVNPVAKEKKSILEFCYVSKDSGSLPLQKWLELKGIKQADCGLVNLPHFKDVYGLFIDTQKRFGYKGIIRKETATNVVLSSIPKGELAATYLYFNKDGYTSYCKEYKEYWDWVKHRNEARYQQNLEHGKQYDTKNMMHTFRLLDMAEEILLEGKILVERPNREALLAIRSGTWSYEALMELADQKMEAVEAAYQKSQLPDAPDRARIEQLLVDLRHAFYR